jgi:hypothetical protein
VDGVDVFIAVLLNLYLGSCVTATVNLSVTRSAPC